jgi:predicted site-specific integrase-resolvase
MELTLEKWAERLLNPVPAKKTLRRWAREGKIVPVPKKSGRAYYVQEDAEYRNWNEPTETQFG